MHARNLIFYFGYLTLALALFVGCTQPKPTSTQVSVAVTERATALLAQMTLDEKIGQMTQADRRYLKGHEDDVTKYALGSVLSGGGSVPDSNTVKGWSDMYDGFQKKALATRLKIPLLYGIDAVHGHNNVYGAVLFPHNIAMGCTRNPELVRQEQEVTAQEVAATGIDWAFAPCIAVTRDERWGRSYESFGETTELAETMGKAAVEGLQGKDLAAPTSVLACLKHFAGDGGTTGGVDQGDTRMDTAAFIKLHVNGYIPGLKAGAATVMASYNSWRGNKMHGQHYWLTDYLKGKLGFEGFIVSDWKGVDELPGTFKENITQSINAGMDMVMVPDRYIEFITDLKQLVNEKKVSQERIDDAVLRILKVKLRMGLFERPYTDRSLAKDFGSDAHRAVARKCVQASLVLLKNTPGVLPLNKTQYRIHVAGRNADNLGYQCGGWSMEWQGKSGNLTKGTTILAAIKKAVSPTTSVTFTEDGSGAAGANIGVVVVGERPYAEFMGDRRDLHLDAADLKAITNLKAAGLPVVLVLISGRPLILDNVLDKCDAIIAAWLPGTEGEGVADVLFGDYKPTGKLSVTWPASMEQIPINVGDSLYKPLYPYGYGLSF